MLHLTSNALFLKAVSPSRKVARTVLRPGRTSSVFWHVGYPRTSTTWLQEAVFPRFPRVNYMGIRYLKSYWYQYDLVTSIAQRSDVRYDQELVRREIGALMLRGQPNVFSSEGLLEWNDTSLVPERLMRLFPQLEHHVIFTNDVFVRRAGMPKGTFPAYSIEQAITEDRSPCRWAECKMSLELPFQQIYKSDEPCACMTVGHRPIPLWFYDVEAMAKPFVEWFGNGRVHFLLLEETAHDPVRTIDRLAGILRVQLTQKEKQSLASVEARNTMKVNSGRQMSELKAAYEAAGGMAEKIRAHFRPLNEKLQHQFPELPLREFGYC